MTPPDVEDWVYVLLTAHDDSVELLA